MKNLFQGLNTFNTNTCGNEEYEQTAKFFDDFIEDHDDHSHIIDEYVNSLFQFQSGYIC